MTFATRVFLKARHWQLFVVLVGVVILGQLAVSSSLSAAPLSQADFQRTGELIGALTAVLTLLLIGWFWSLGSFLKSLSPPRERPSLRWFRFSLVYAAAYVLVFLAVLSREGAPPALIIPFHLLAMFCMIYNLHFVAKSLVLAETGRATSFYDYAGPFFLLWFFPIGVWVIQPRINRLFAASLERKLTTEAH